MKKLINFTTASDDVARYSSSKELTDFYQQFSCDGLELMPIQKEENPLIKKEMVIGIHACCIGNWMDLEQKELLNHYRKDLDYTKEIGAEYVVFHVTQVTDIESFTYQLEHSDEEVICAAINFINLLLDGQDYDFYFLMENLWWNGLNFLDEKMTQKLLDGVHYEKKGFMLDTGHYLHTNRKLQTQKEALVYLHEMLDRHENLIPYIKGIHLQQSLSGSYVQEWLKTPHTIPEDPQKRFCELYEHIFRIDQHLPFTTPKIKHLVERINPLYLTFEYITKDKEEHFRYLEAGTKAVL